MRGEGAWKRLRRLLGCAGLFEKSRPALNTRQNPGVSRRIHKRQEWAGEGLPLQPRSMQARDPWLRRLIEIAGGSMN